MPKAVFATIVLVSIVLVILKMAKVMILVVGITSFILGIIGGLAYFGGSTFGVGQLIELAQPQTKKETTKRIMLVGFILSIVSYILYGWI